MSTPVAAPTDLELYLGIATGTIDTNRATLVLSMSQDLCETIVTPLPASARAVVLAVAARAFSNVTSAHQVNLGSASVAFGSQGSQMGVGGLYLSRTDKATLRRLAGRGAAFSVDTLPTGLNAVQTVTVAATAGTFTLAFQGAVTSPLAYNATAAQVQSALQALGSINAGNVAVSGAYVVTFQGTMATMPVPALIADGSALTGSVTVTQTVVGVFSPGQTLPPWDRDYLGNYNALGSQIYGGGY